MRRRSRAARPAWCASTRKSTPGSKWPRFIAASARPAGRRCCSRASRAAAFRWSATCSARWTGPGSCSATASSASAGLCELKLDPTAGLRHPLAVRRRGSRARPAMLPTIRPPRRRHRQRNDDLATAAAGELAERRRRVHHAAAGLHRRRPRAGLAALEPRHVPRAAFRQPVRAGPRGRPALSNPPLDRRAPRGRDRARASRFA